MLFAEPSLFQLRFDLAQKLRLLGDYIQSLALWIDAMVIELLYREHRNIERLLAVLDGELEIFDRGERPDYEVIRAVIDYFEVYLEAYHHPQEDLVFAKLRIRGCKDR